LRGPNGEDDVYADKKNVNSERNDATSIKKQSKGKKPISKWLHFSVTKR
jgi:hypothetical protein